MPVYFLVRTNRDNTRTPVLNLGDFPTYDAALDVALALEEPRLEIQIMGLIYDDDMCINHLFAVGEGSMPAVDLCHAANVPWKRTTDPDLEDGEAAISHMHLLHAGSSDFEYEEESETWKENGEAVDDPVAALQQALGGAKPPSE